MSTSRHERAPLASERIDRVLYIAVGFGGLIFIALALGTATSQYPLLHVAEGAPLLVLLAVICAMFVVIPSFLPIPVLRVVASVYIVIFTVALAAWLPLQTSTTLPNQASPWLLTIIAVATSCAAIAWSQRWAWSYIIAVCVGAAFVRFFADAKVTVIVATEEFFYMLLICTVFASLIQVIRTAGRRQDVAARAAHADAALAGESRARIEQRARFGALVHDDVISTLLVASRGEPGMRESVREYAKRALTRIAAIREPQAPNEDVPPSECAARLRAASDLPGAPALAVTIKTTRPVPASVVQSMGEALGEALRNSMRHAAPDGRQVHRTASAIIDRDGILIDIGDDGVGFSLQRIPPERLGLRVSVIGRMTAVSGGSARVTSRPHEGTQVTLVWSRPREAARAR